MELRNITMDSEYKAEAENIYIEAFPERERIFSFDAILAMSEQAGLMKAKAAFEDDKIIGIFVFMEKADYVYGMFFAVNGSLRGGGYGSKLIKAFLEEYKSKNVVCLIETPIPGASNYEQRVKRKIFYERVGMLMTEYSFGTNIEDDMTFVTSKRDGRQMDYMLDCAKIFKKDFGLSAPENMKFYVTRDGKREEIQPPIHSMQDEA